MAMLLMMLEKKIKVDRIVFFDTKRVPKYYKTQYGLFPIDEKFCFNCRYHMRYFKELRLATCFKSGIVTDVAGWCEGWKHIHK